MKLVNSQRKLFSILDEFFKMASGTGIEAVTDLSSFGGWVRKNSEAFAARGSRAFPWVYDSLVKFYDESRQQNIFSQAKQLGGIKLVLGGTSRFTGSHLNSVRKMLLYADTILIPDPILPWVESPREEERFRDVIFWEQVFILLHLKPIIDAELPYPAIVIFPSWEKSLEKQDSQTREGQINLVTGVLGHSLGHSFQHYTEITEFSGKHSTEFLQLVDKNRLLIGPGGNIGEPLNVALKRYKDDIRTWRSAEYQNMVDKSSDSLITLIALTERISPLYHLFENAEELFANPMFCLPVHWHYYSLCAQLFQYRLEKLSLLDTKSLAEIRALEAQQLEWLGDIPIEAIAELRKRGENDQFRKSLREFTDRLHEANLQDLNQVAAEVGRGIASLVVEHQNEIRRIQEKYDKKTIHTALITGVTGAALLFPALAPFLGGAAVLAPTGKFTWDMISKALDKRLAGQSLMGVLAEAKRKHKSVAFQGRAFQGRSDRNGQNT
jgi:hypothetical protein